MRTATVRLSWALLLLLPVLPACAGDDAQPSLDPAGMPASEELSDELDDPATLSRWRQWDEVDGEARTEHLDLAQSNPGMLTLRPKAGGWYGSYSGPLIYKMVSGDFRVETWVSAAKLGNPEAPPDEQFNSAGLIARDPEHGPGHDDWVMVNTGRQLGELVGSEGKTTVGSQSVLELVEGAWRGRLRICRVGAVMIVARMLEGETAWRVLGRYERGDLPEDLQVGMVATAWNTSAEEPELSRAGDVEARFDYVRFSVPEGEAGCLGE